MRKFTLLLFLSAMVFAGFAQRSAVQADKTFQFEMPTIKGEGDITDTLVPASFLTGTPTLYTTSAGGYVAGTNGYGDLAKAQQFATEDAYVIEGVMIWVGVNALEEGDLNVTVWDFDAAPTTELAVQTVPFAQVTTTTPMEDGSFFHTVIFDEPVTVSGDFVVGTAWDGSITDGFGLISTTDFDAGETALSWEQWSDGSWLTILDAWPLDIDLGIFPLVSEAAVEMVNVTFNVDMTTHAEFDAANDTVWITGNFAGWAEPGSEGSMFLTDEDADMIYTLTVEVEENYGEVLYKYFDGPSWDNGEWAGDPNRTIEVATEDIVTDDVWSFKPNVEASKLAAISLFPNPVKDVINLTSTDGVAEIFVSNVLGQTVYSTNAVSTTINVADLNDGIYIVTLVSENGASVSERIVKK